MNRVLVVGGDGQIGRALVPALSDAGHSVAATSRRGGRVLDLAGWDGDPTQGFDAVVITAAVTGRAACAADPEAAFSVNVTAPERLATPVLARGGRVVFLSTHIVLGGDGAFLPVGAPHAPCDIYSEQKAAAERRLLALPGAARGLTILRPTKVLDARVGVVGAWRARIAAGEPIDVYTDLVMAPVATVHAVARIAGILREGSAGIVHLSGDREVSFADFAGLLRGRLGWDGALIRRMAGRPVNPIAAATPPHASLACDDPVPVKEVIAALCG
jgi:dTDP-4-dehydrorhamnose reductase